MRPYTIIQAVSALFINHSPPAASGAIMLQISQRSRGPSPCLSCRLVSIEGLFGRCGRFDGSLPAKL